MPDNAPDNSLPESPADSPENLTPQPDTDTDEVVEILDSLSGDGTADENKVTNDLLDIFEDIG